MFKKDFLLGLLIFVLVIFLFYYFPKNNLILMTAFLILSALILLRWTTKEEKFIYFTAFTLVPIIDITVIPTGIWAYGSPTFFGIPVWLPLSYGILVVTAIKISRGIFGIISR